MVFACLIGILILSAEVNAQDGPGGVGRTDGTSSLLYWLDANSSATSVGGQLSQINDLSGNNTTNTIVGTPLLAESIVNGRNAISFNGVNQQVQTQAIINATIHPNLTVIAVYQPTADYARSAWGDYAAGWGGRFITNNNFDLPRTANFAGPGYEPTIGHPSTVIPGLFNTNQWTISAVAYREDIANGTFVRVNGQNERSFLANHDASAYTTFSIGAGGPPPTAFWFAGNVAEVIVTNEALNGIDLILIDNYLSAKYNVPLSQNDLFSGDNFGFDFDVAGVGRLSASVARLSSQGTGILTIDAPNIENNEFLFWGHNNGNLQALNTTDVSGAVLARSNRLWYANEVSNIGSPVDAGTLSLTFDLSGLGAINANDLALLVDTDGDGVFSDESPQTGAFHVGGQRYQFQGVTSIADGRTFTIGSINLTTTPLPVTLLHFEARTLSQNETEFTWATASEKDNNYFEVFKSQDGLSWTSIAVVKGSANSNAVINYRHVAQYQSEMPRSYYKLTQVDFDGNVTQLKVIKVENDDLVRVYLYPNPASYSFQVAASAFSRMEIYDSAYHLIKASSSTHVDIGDLMPGLYFVYVYLPDQLVIKKMIVLARP